jgi:general stress protein 26
MNILPQNTTELDHLAHLIEGIPIGMLTTIEADGSLSARPMAALEMDGQGALWFFTDLRSPKVANLKVAHLSFTDSARSTYVSISGRGEMHSDRAQIQRLWTAFAKPWFPDGPDSPDLALLKFVPDTVDYWDGPRSRMVRTVGMIVSAIAGKPMGLGEHGTHTGLSPVLPA